MTGKESGAYELKHCGKIHRASDLSQLLQWVKEYRSPWRTASDRREPTNGCR